MDRTAGIVIIGDEILSGKFADENAQFLIGALAGLGVTLRRVSIIPDDIEDIAGTVRRFSERFDWVFTSGGVGPTHDDMTIPGIAHGFGTRVVIHPALEKVLREYWGPTMPEANLRLAEVPEGAESCPGRTAPPRRAGPWSAIATSTSCPGCRCCFGRSFSISRSASG